MDGSIELRPPPQTPASKSKEKARDSLVPAMRNNTDSTPHTTNICWEGPYTHCAPSSKRLLVNHRRSTTR
eukprot:5555465-Pyramimonas_sp.AAC.1